MFRSGKLPFVHGWRQIKGISGLRRIMPCRLFDILISVSFGVNVPTRNTEWSGSNGWRDYRVHHPPASTQKGQDRRPTRPRLQAAQTAKGEGHCLAKLRISIFRITDTGRLFGFGICRTALHAAPDRRVTCRRAWRRVSVTEHFPDPVAGRCPRFGGGWHRHERIFRAAAWIKRCGGMVVSRHWSAKWARLAPSQALHNRRRDHTGSSMRPKCKQAKRDSESLVDLIQLVEQWDTTTILPTPAGACPVSGGCLICCWNSGTGRGSLRQSLKQWDTWRNSLSNSGWYRGQVDA